MQRWPKGEAGNFKFPICGFESRSLLYGEIVKDKGPYRTPAPAPKPERPLTNDELSARILMAPDPEIVFWRWMMTYESMRPVKI